MSKFINLVLVELQGIQSKIWEIQSKVILTKNLDQFLQSLFHQ